MTKNTKQAVGLAPALNGAKAERVQAVHIMAPPWYEREDFLDFINGRRESQGDSRPATWHLEGQEADEYSDVFVTYDGEEGSDADHIPPDIWEAICVLVREQGITGYAIVRISCLL